MFCPRCGEEKEHFAGKICVDCYLDENEVVEVPDNLRMTVCFSCGAVKVDGWVEEGIERAAARLVRDEIETAGELDNVVTNLDVREVLPNLLKGTLTVEGSVGGRRVATSREVGIDLDTGVCKRCSRASQGYYEAVLQVRGSDRVILDEEVEKILSVASKLAEAVSSAGGEKPFVSRVEEVSGGFDLYLGDSKTGKELAHKLKSRFGGETTESASLIGEQDGQRVYRTTYLFRLPSFRQGDVVKVEGRYYSIESLGQRVELRDLETGVQKYVDVDEMEQECERVGSLDDVEETVLTMVDGDEVQVLHPETMQARTLAKPFFIDREDQGGKVEVLVTDDSLLIVNPEVLG